MTQATDAPAGAIPTADAAAAADAGVVGGAAAGVLPGGRRSVGVVAKALFLLTKPRIIELLLVTT
ncbi:MAG: heme o synthase, partial [Streptosporangiaceae bacterium]